MKKERTELPRLRGSESGRNGPKYLTKGTGIAPEMNAVKSVLLSHRKKKGGGRHPKSVFLGGKEEPARAANAKKVESRLRALTSEGGGKGEGVVT